MLRGRLSLALPASPRPSDGVIGLLLGLAAVSHHLQGEDGKKTRYCCVSFPVCCNSTLCSPIFRMPRACKVKPVMNLLKQKGKNKREDQSQGKIREVPPLPLTIKRGRVDGGSTISNSWGPSSPPASHGLPTRQLWLRRPGSTSASCGRQREKSREDAEPQAAFLRSVLAGHPLARRATARWRRMLRGRQRRRSREAGCGVNTAQRIPGCALPFPGERV